MVKMHPLEFMETHQQRATAAATVAASAATTNSRALGTTTGAFPCTVTFDQRAAHKPSNPDVSVSFNSGPSSASGSSSSKVVSVKFHERPIYAVVADELKETAAEAAAEAEAVKKPANKR